MQKLKSYINHSLKEKIEWFIIIILVMLPMVIGTIYIYSFGVNVPFLDQWSMIPLYEKMFSNNLSISDLFVQSNESRLFFSGILMMILVLTTGYNNVSEMFFIYFLYCMSFFVMFTMYKKDHEVNKKSLILFIPISWFFFNLAQMNNMLFGIRIAQASEILTFLFAVYLVDLSKTLDKRFLGAIVSAIISTFSFVSGLLTWPVIFIQLTLSDSKEKMKKIFIWCVFGILTYVLYFHDYKKPGYHPSLLYSFNNPFEATAVFFSSVGSTITRDFISSQIIGVLIIAITCSILLLNKNNLNLDKNAKWYSLIVYSFFVSVEITIGRSGFGTHQGIVIRYLLLTFFSIIGLYFVLLNVLNVNQYKKKYGLNYLFLCIVLCLLILGVSTFFIKGIEYGTEIRQFREETAYYLETYKIQPDKNLQKLYPVPSFVRKNAAFLEKHRLNVFSDDNIDIDALTKSSNGTSYYIDTINGKAVDMKKSIVIYKEKDEEIIITGWAIDTYEHSPAGGVFITIDGKVDIPARYSIDRKDVSDAYKNDNFRYSGFMASFASTIIGNGNHNATIKIVSTDRTRYYEQKQKIDFMLI